MLAKELALPVATHSTRFGREENWGEIKDGRWSSFHYSGKRSVLRTGFCKSDLPHCISPPCWQRKSWMHCSRVSNPVPSCEVGEGNESLLITTRDYIDPPVSSSFLKVRVVFFFLSFTRGIAYGQSRTRLIQIDWLPDSAICQRSDYSVFIFLQTNVITFEFLAV